MMMLGIKALFGIAYLLAIASYIKCQRQHARSERRRATRTAIGRHPEWSMHRAAITLKKNRERLIQLVKLSFLSPEIVGAIHEGRHPATITPRALLAAELPMRWDQQKVALGFG